MQSRARLGLGGITLVALIALIAGAVAGALTARATASTKTIKQVIQSGAQNPVSLADTSSGTPMSWEAVAHRAGPAVVTIINHLQPQQNFFNQTVPGGTAEGSGFIIDTKGDIVTNNHVVAGHDPSQAFQVVFSDGTKATARLVHAGDVQDDLAVLKVSVPVHATLSWGDSAALQPGEPVMAIGSALGQFRNTVTAGVVSALGRSITEPTNVTLQNMIQTDAAINEGNSGGPLLNDRGQVVGINTAITRGSQSTDLFGQSSSVVAEGLGFAIPSDTAKAVAVRLVANKPPALLGVRYEQISSQDAAFYGFPVGAYVRQVDAGSPAARAGIHVRDIITKVDTVPLSDNLQLEQVIADRDPGQVVKLSVWRNGKILTVKVKLGAKA